MSEDKQPNIREKVLEWLSNEGYPLEFLTTNIFRKHKFWVNQGKYYEDIKTNAIREIDVLAKISIAVDSSFLRIYYAVECKWSRNKPWVVFTDSSSSIAPSACISQTMATKSAKAVLWALAGKKELHEMLVFQTPNRPGFSGRQSLTKKHDYFYSALQSVITASQGILNFYERHQTKPKDYTSHGVVVFPLIVLDGQLFEAFFNETSKELEIKEMDRIRIHWRGAEAWRLHASIDIVTVDALDDYVAKLHKETHLLLKHMKLTFQEINDCFAQKSLEPLNVTEGPRGIIGLPELLTHIKPNKNIEKKPEE